LSLESLMTSLLLRGGLWKRRLCPDND
jgi:hypothetical protein